MRKELDEKTLERKISNRTADLLEALKTAARRIADAEKALLNKQNVSHHGMVQGIGTEVVRIAAELDAYIEARDFWKEIE